MYALSLAENGRILSVTFAEYAPEGAVIVDSFPDGDISDYLYVDGAFIYDPLPEPEAPEDPASEYVTWAELAAALAEGVNSI